MSDKTNYFLEVLKKVTGLIKLFPFNSKEEKEALGKYQTAISLRTLDIIKKSLPPDQQQKYFAEKNDIDPARWYQEVEKVIDQRMDKYLAQEINAAILDETKVFCRILLSHCPLNHKTKLEAYVNENNLI